MIFFYFFIFIFYYFIFAFQNLMELQLSGYEIFYPFVYTYRLIKSKIIYLLILIVLTVAWLIFFQTNLYVSFAIFLLELLIIFCSFFNIKNFKKLKYTRRMMRIILMSFLMYFLTMYLISKFLISDNFILLNFIAFIISPIVLSLSLILLYPIEKMIGKYFILKAKKIINGSSLLKIGITGSFGKTSVKEILVSILKRKYPVLATPKSFNTPLGISRTINENFSATDEIFVCEMGAKKVGEIDELCQMVNVDLGIVTAVGRQHTKTFGSIDNIYKTKFELPNYLGSKPCVFNLMNLYTFKMFKEYRNSIGVYVCYKRHLKCNHILKTFWIYNSTFTFKNKIRFFVYPRCNVFSARNIELTCDDSQFDVYNCSQFLFRTKINLIGLHNIINSMLAIAMSQILGVDNVDIDYGLKNIKKIDARCEIIKSKNGGIVINNGYNSNIDSVDFMLKTLLLFNKKNIVIVSPGLIESENDYLYNKLLGKKFSRVATEIVIVKDKNKKALVAGIRDGGFDMSNVRFLASFSDIKNEINNCDGDYVYLIENDLPDNFK